MITLLDRTLARIQRGRDKGRVNSVKTGIPMYDDLIDGTTQGTMYLYGAETSVGKTTFVRDKHIYTPYEYYKVVNDPSKFDVLFVDFSLEMSPEINMAAAMSRKLFLQEGIVLPVKRILKNLSDEHMDIIMKKIAPYFDDFQKKMMVIDEDLNPDKYHEILMEVAKMTGTFAKEGRWISECDGWVAKNPNQFVILVVDTVNLAEDDHDSIKRVIDRISRISVWFRNKCGFIPIIIQQFNADISGVERVHKFGLKTPMLRDFEDSKRPVKDADIVVGLYDPIRHMKQDEVLFHGYDIAFLRNWFRSLHLMKNRFGENNRYVPLKFDGAVGVFEQMPSVEDMTIEKYQWATEHHNGTNINNAT